MSETSRAAGFREILNQHKAEQSQETYKLKAPSGMIYEVHDPPFEMFAIAGILPVGLSEKMSAARARGATESEVFHSLSRDFRKQQTGIVKKSVLQMSIA